MTPPPSTSFCHLLYIYIKVTATILFIICFIIFVNAVLVCIIFLDNGIPALLLPHRTLSHGSYWSNHILFFCYVIRDQLRFNLGPVDFIQEL